MKIIALFLMIAFLPVPVFAGSETWGFVQSVGGLAIGKPLHETEGWVLPVRADVSGLSAVTVKPTTLNSALVCQRVESTIEGRNIYITIVTALVHSSASPICPSAKLGEMPNGEYTIYYLGPGEDPVRLGDVSLGL